MDKWVDAVEKRGKTINLSEIEMDKDLLVVLQERKSRYEKIGAWVIEKKDVQKFWEWVPVYIEFTGDELSIYCVNVWKSSSKFKTFICVKPGIDTNERSDVDKHLIIYLLKGDSNV
uniref:Uncharacterized protein n=1 Tax=Pithovirus LCPAC401 TaxID=2506595 RepID=A0A481ZAE1_9VIRU|nr:MAG: hypothetical protein LCPAC401_03850 [Pithovirus LCPAC401]